MAAVDINIEHQNYIEFTGLNANESGSGSLFSYETENTTVKDFIEALPLAESVKQYREFLVVLDEKKGVIDKSSKLADVIGANTTLGVDFTDHMVLQFTTLGADSNA